MSRHSRVNQVDRGIQAIAADGSTAPAPDQDADQLAREVVRAYADELKRYDRLKVKEPCRFNPADPPCDIQIESAREMPPEDVTFGTIANLTRVDPAQGQARWEEVKAAARRDLDIGWLAGRALEFLGGSAWERACFLAVRDRLRCAWQPRNPCEAMLVDEMAQYETIRQRWLAVFAMRSREPETLIHRKRLADSPEERRLTASEETAEAARMLERVQRLFQNAARTLLSIRRGKAPTIFQRTGQVNVSLGQQLNVSAPASIEEQE